MTSTHIPARVVAVIQARMGSSRLPGKVMMPLGGRPVLGWVIRAALEAGLVDAVAVATSDRSADDEVAAFAEQSGVEVVRGSEDDVLGRYVLACNATGADAVVRLTADCPFLDRALINAVVGAWRASPGLEYVATTLVRTLPRGLDVELVSRTALLRADAHATDHHRSHVTSWLYEKPDRCRSLGIVVDPPANQFRVTLDTPEDARLLTALARVMSDSVPAWESLVATLRSRPDLTQTVERIQQKTSEEG